MSTARTSNSCDLHWDVYKLNEVSNETHDGEADCDSLADLHEFCVNVSEH